MTDAEGRAGDVWTIGSAPGEANTLAVRTVDAGGGARTHFTRTLRTRSEILFGRPDGLKRLLGDGTLEDVAAGQFSSPAWSPDGTRIAFYRQVDVDGNRVARIYTMNADGTGTPECVSCAAAITPVTQEYSPLWSPDGSQILFARGIAPVEIWIMDASGSGARRLTTGEHPTWSPDGTEIAFRQHTVSTSAIHVMNSDGTGVFRLSNYMEPESYPAWSPDGEEIVFSRSGAGLVLVKREAGTLQRTLGVSGLPVAWSVDGEKVLIRGLDHDGRPLLATVDVGTSAIDELWIAPDVSPQQLTIGNQSWRGCMP
ncbi:MAG: hypothetical protein GWN71_43400 [Gammaproteobacteria bacterium]|nr:hypothetical protein [Gemmatimonadota bacterium]NIR41991.1 hypothetical protein [Actinomycetota bacterium]NIU80139.1 hypothetical protein [Gammaproteobacteria bacterium]NIX25639.1 hypothetical protein [Actinomycetota bacterium]